MTLRHQQTYRRSVLDSDLTHRNSNERPIPFEECTSVDDKAQFVGHQRGSNDQCSQTHEESPSIFLAVRKIRSAKSTASSEIYSPKAIPTTGASQMGIVAEFARYKAKLVNPNWAVSAITEREAVFSLWRHRMKVEDGHWVYRDFIGRWSGHGNRLFAEHLATALRLKLPIRLVLATTNDEQLVEAGGDASKARNSFLAKPEWVGTVSSFDGDHFRIDFHRDPPVGK
jgi:hypothetical protein